MGKRKAMEIGVWSFDKRLAKWDLFWPIHLMWVSYIAELMGLKLRPRMLPTKEEVGKAALPNIGNMQAKILKADFHGCVVKGAFSVLDQMRGDFDQLPVKECRNTSRVGLEGIIVHETSNTFKVVTRKNELKGEIYLLDLLDSD
jgi:ribonuclease P protein subunit POP4